MGVAHPRTPHVRSGHVYLAVNYVSETTRSYELDRNTFRILEAMQNRAAEHARRAPPPAPITPSPSAPPPLLHAHSRRTFARVPLASSHTVPCTAQLMETASKPNRRNSDFDALDWGSDDDDGVAPPKVTTPRTAVTTPRTALDPVETAAGPGSERSPWLA